MGFFIRDEAGRLDGIHQELQLGQLELPISQMVGAVPSAVGTDDIQTVFLQFRKIAVKGLPVCIDPILVQPFRDFLQGETMFIIGFPLEDLLQVQHLQFLIDSFGHGSLLRVRYGFFLYDILFRKKKEHLTRGKLMEAI